MKRISCLALAAAALHAAPAGADDDHVALLKNVTGAVEIVREDGRQAAAPGLQLFVSDRLVSGAGASAGIVFRDGTQLTLGPAAELDVRAYTFRPRDAEYAFDVYLARGSAVYASGKIGKLAPGAVKVGTPTATVGVRGTRFIVEAQ